MNDFQQDPERPLDKEGGFFIEMSIYGLVEKSVSTKEVQRGAISLQNSLVSSCRRGVGA